MSKSLYIIDRRVADYRLLISGLPEGADWVLLDADRDGVEQIASLMSGYSDISSLHIVSHGSEGALYLGSTSLTLSNLNDYASYLADIGSFLTDDADILLYGCDVAFGLEGLAFVERFASLTEADVAASSDLTGGAASGGDWVLETQSGTIAAQSLSVAEYTSTLATSPYLINKPASWSFSEDGSTSFEVVLSFATPENVRITVALSEGLCWLDGATGSKVFTFAPDNFNVPQAIAFKAIDDLVIEGDLLHYVNLSFASSDPVFNGLAEQLSVVVVDNDFQRTLEPGKLPSTGNNYIKYDLAGDAKAQTSNGLYDLAAGNDRLEVSASLADSVKTTLFLGGTGNDILSGVGGVDGGSGDDVMSVSSAGLYLLPVTVKQYNGPSTSSTLIGSYGFNIFVGKALAAGGEGNDQIDAALATVSANLAGGSGNDQITGSAQSDLIYGDGYEGIGPITLNQFWVGSSSSSSAQSYAESQFPFSSATSAAGNDVIDGGAGNDTIYAGGGDDIVTGGLGDDVIDAGTGADQVFGGDGNDNITGGAGNDTIDAGEGTNTVDAGDGDDVIVTGSSNDTVSGGKGIDTITLGAGNDSASGGDEGDAISGGAGNDNLSGGAGDDAILGESGNDVLAGDAGNDRIEAGEGDDTLNGGTGNDTLLGQEGNDTLDGGDGDDTLTGSEGVDSLTGGLGNDTLDGGIGNDLLRGGDGVDRLLGGAGVDLLYGDAGDDTLDGGADNDTLEGGDGNDALTGGDGNDTLTAGAGNDILTGGAGNDILRGNDGADILTGGAGVDGFILDAIALIEAAQTTPVYDTVQDFLVGTGGDILDLSDIHGANLDAGYGDRFAGAEFAYTHGYIRFVQSGADTLVQYDRDGLYGDYSGKTVAILKSVVASEVLAGINTSPANSSKLYLIESSKLSPGLAEDAGALIQYRVVLGRAPASDVTLIIQGGDQIAVNGGAGTSAITFTASNWWIPQTVTVQAQDDLLIEGNVAAIIDHSFTSSDPVFNGLAKQLSVVVVDNDFQRTLEPGKLPSTGNNYIKYDLAGDAKAQTSNGLYDLAAGNDRLEVSASLADSVKTTLFLGGTGNDILSGVGGVDGGSGDDVMSVSSAGLYLLPVTVKQYNGPSTSSTLIGSYGFNIFVGKALAAGGEGNDQIDAALATVSANLAGGSGNDQITGSAQSDLIYGDGYEGIGPITLNQFWVGSSSSSSAQSYAESQFPFSSATSAAGNDVIDGGAGNDTIYAGGGDDIVTGGLGDDVIDAGTGADQVFGGDGNDNITGGAGNDTIDAGEGTNTVDAGDGDDVIVTGSSNDTVSGGKGIDTITLGAGNDSASGGDEGDAISGGAGNDNLSGGAGDDAILGESGNDVLAGDAGNDRIEAGEGDDTLNGGTGNDTLLGQEGNDTLDGGDGDDTLTGSEGVDSLTGGLGNDTLDGGIGNDLLRGGDGVDRLLGGAGVDLLYGDAGDDTLDGGADNDTLEGGDGNDALTGGDGNDTLTAGAGNDILTGGAGNDILRGNDGADILTGGAGVDGFILDAIALIEAAQTTPVYDTVQDFLVGTGGDILDLSDIHGANLDAGYGDRFAGAEFAYTHGYIRFVQSGADTLVQYDRDGLYGDYSGKTVAILKSVVASEVLAGINTSPANSSKLYLIESSKLSPGLAEDAGALIQYRVVLGRAPASDVTLIIQGGDQIAVNGGAGTSAITFTASNWWIPQTVTVQAQDDLLIEGNVAAIIDHSFTSSDPVFNGLAKQLSVVVVDNDFQRTLEPGKLPSTGNNYIKYDLAGDAKAQTSNGLYDLAAGNDRLEVSASLADSVKTTLFLGGTGNDILSGVGGVDGGSGDDVMSVSSAGLYLLPVTVKQYNGPSTSSTLIGSYGFNIFVGKALAAGGEGNDQIDAALATVSANLAGGSGNDQITGSAQSDLIYGDGYEGIGPITLNQFWVGSSSSSSAQSYAESQFPFSSATSAAGNDVIDGGAGNDTIYAGGGDDIVTGGLGDDVIDAGTGADQVFGGDGNDNITGGAGNDTIDAGEGTNTVDAGDGDDVIVTGSSNDTVSGGKGIDTITLGAGNDSASGGDEGDAISGGAGNDNLSGGAGDDAILGESGNDVLAGDAGNDRIEAGEGDDTLNGGTGNDTLLGQEGNDTLDGGDGDDTLTGSEGVDSLTGGLGNDTLDGGIGNDLLRGGDGVDRLLGGAGVDLLYGDAGDDTLDGGADNDTLEGGDGNDALTGGDGNDTLTAGAGNDILTGGAGNDILRGNDGADILTGGAGVDGFILDAIALIEAAQTTPVYDTVQDFLVGTGGDILDLSDIHGANLDAGYGDRFAGAEFAYTHGYIRFVQSGADTLVQYDRDGLYGDYSGKTVAILKSVVASEVLAGINTSPANSSKLYLIESSKLSPGLAEDAGALIQYRVVLGRAPASDVTLIIQGGDQIAVNGGAGTSAITFTASNWWIPQTVTVQAQDDLLIEGNVAAIIDHSFTSSDPVFNGLAKQLSVVVVDNDFQRTLEPGKLPSTGNNYIKYDLAGDAKAQTSNGLYDLAAGNDRLEVSASLADSVKTTLFLGGTGNDILSGVGGVDGGSGDDVMSVSSAGLYLLPVTVKQYNGPSTSSTLIGSYGFNIFVGKALAAGGEGNDQIDAALATVSANLAGGSGNDQITGSAQSDLIYGDGYEGIGPITLNQFWVGSSSSSSAQSYAESQFPFSSATSAAGNDVIDGGAGNDTIYAGGGDDIVTGGLGDDVIDAGTGADQVFGGDGNDNITGGAGNDTIDAGEGTNTVDAGDGDDVIVTGSSNDTVSGGKGIDTITLGAGNDSASGGDEGDAISGGAGNDNLSGGAGDDAILGESGNDVLAGDAGNDRIEAGEGDDTLNGGTGNDTLLGQEGNDTLDGGDGDDTLTGSEGVDSLTGGLGNDTLDGGIGNDLLRGGDGVDRLLGGAGVDLLYGDAGDDTLDGGADNDTLEGGDGNDALTGGDGNDTLTAGAGNDILTGGAGNDILRGNDGADILTGGAGVDTFGFSFSALDDATDFITDFSAGVGGDKLDLSAIHAANIALGNATWAAPSLPFTHGYVRIVQQGSDAVIGYDRDGYGSNYFFEPITTLSNVDATTLTADNFTFGQENFGLVRTGFVLEQTLLGNGNVMIGLDLWGGAPASNVEIVVKNKSGVLLGSVSFTPTDWQGQKTVSLSGISDTFVAAKDLVFQVVSTDADYAASTLAMAIINETYVYAKPLLLAPQLSVVSAVNGAGAVGISSNLPANTQTSSAVRLVSLDDPSLVVQGNLMLSGTSGTLSVSQSTLAGVNRFVGFATVNGSQVSFPVNIQFDNPNSATVTSSAAIIQEGGVVQLQITLAKPAGEAITLNWAVSGSGAGPASGTDFFMGTLPSGSVSFVRGETTKLVQISTVDDLLAEQVEAFRVDFSLATGALESFPASANLLIRDNDIPGQSGIINYWNGASLDLDVQFLREDIPVTQSGATGFQNISYDSVSKILTMEFWALPAEIGQNFDLSFDLPAGVTASVVTSGGLSGWTFLSNLDGKELIVAGIGSTPLAGGGSAEMFTVTFTNVDASHVPFLSAGIVGDQAISSHELYQTVSAFTENGLTNFAAGNGSYSAAQIHLNANDIDMAIDSRDALLALKIANGSVAAADLQSPLQILAADVTGNGAVTTLDAWHLLRAVVGIDNPRIGAVGLVESGISLSAITADNAYTELLNSVSLGSATPFGATAFIVGDVDGSYVVI